MRQPSENEGERDPSPVPDLEKLVAGFLRDEHQAERRLHAWLTSEVLRSTRRYFREHDLDFGAIVADSVSSVMLHIQKQGGFKGRLLAFTVAVARNRCRGEIRRRRRRGHVEYTANLHPSPHSAPSPLDGLVREEMVRHLQPVLDGLGEFCRFLLRAHYIEGRPMKDLLADLRRSTDAPYKTLQGLYDRRRRCLAEALKRLLDRLEER